MTTTNGHETMELYTKDTSNFPGGYPLTDFIILSPTWSGESVLLPFGEEGEEEHEVVGWTDLFFGSACTVSVTRVRDEDGNEGYLVHGGNSGVRILNEDAPAYEWNEHLPRGVGYPFVWIDEMGDLPEEVREVVNQEEED